MRIEATSRGSRVVEAKPAGFSSQLPLLGTLEELGEDQDLLEIAYAPPAPVTPLLDQSLAREVPEIDAPPPEPVELDNGLPFACLGDPRAACLTVDSPSSSRQCKPLSSAIRRKVSRQWSKSSTARLAQSSWANSSIRPFRACRATEPANADGRRSLWVGATGHDDVIPFSTMSRGGPFCILPVGERGSASSRCKNSGSLSLRKATSWPRVRLSPDRGMRFMRSYGNGGDLRGGRPMPNEAWGVGTSLLRREDERHLHRRGEFVSDIKFQGPWR
jgi:hypothetical protein